MKVTHGACCTWRSSPHSWIWFLSHMLCRFPRWLLKSSSSELHLFVLCMPPDHITVPTSTQLTLPSLPCWAYVRAKASSTFRWPSARWLKKTFELFLNEPRERESFFFEKGKSSRALDSGGGTGASDLPTYLKPTSNPVILCNAIDSLVSFYNSDCISLKSCLLSCFL